MTINRSTYYKRPDEAIADVRRQAETALRSAIDNVLGDWPCYGYRRVTHELRRRGIVVNHKKVARVMREGALTPRRVKRFVVTTDSDHDLPVFADLTKGFVPSGPDQLWVADLTYIRLTAEFAYFAAILDAWSRRVVGYALGNTLETRLTLAALDAAIRSRRPAAGLIHHSDRGSQYAAKAYRERLELHGIRSSMSRRANPYDNAKAESFMKTLKHEEVNMANYRDLDDVRRRLPHFIEDVYNAQRLHSALGYLPPNEFEQNSARQVVNS
jgi:putative transposase